MGWLGDAIVWLYHWQTIVGAGLALGGALWTIRHIRNQHDQTERLEQARLERQHTATRAISTLAFSQVCQSCERLIVRLGALRRETPQERVGDVAGPLSLNLSNEIVPTLERFLAVIDEAALIELVSEFITRIQVTESRLGSMVVINDFEVEKRTLDVAEVYAFAELLLLYSRRELSGPPYRIENERLRSVLNICHIREDRSPEIHARLEEFHPLELPLWVSS